MHRYEPGLNVYAVELCSVCGMDAVCEMFAHRGMVAGVLCLNPRFDQHKAYTSEFSQVMGPSC